MIYTELRKNSLKIPTVIIRSRKWEKRENEDKHIDLQNSFTCTGLKYFVDIIWAFSNIRTNAEYVTSISAIFANKKTEPVFVNCRLHQFSK